MMETNIEKDCLAWVSHSPEETRQFALQLAEHLRPGDVIALQGDLGAGKTCFTQGLARGLGVAGTVNSPTFTIIKEYLGRIPLYHMDVYRMGDGLEDLGFEEYFYGEGVSVVEWAGMIEPVLPADRLTVEISSVGEMERRICLIPHGDRFKSLCKEIANEHTGN